MTDEKRLAYGMLLPTVIIVLGIVLFPLAMNIWISFKPVKLADLRAPEVFVSESLRGDLKQRGDEGFLRYRLRNSSQNKPVFSVRLEDEIPQGLSMETADSRCSLEGRRLICELGDWKPKQTEKLEFPVRVIEDLPRKPNPREWPAITHGTSENILTSLSGFTLKNYAKVFFDDEFLEKLKITFFYTFFGTAGALILGLFAAQLMNVPFRGRAFLRGLFLFPYVSPVIAVAFTWVAFLDPFSGFLNSLFAFYGWGESPVNFLGTKSAEAEILGFRFEFPLALITVTAFEAWRYFPLAFLFILARMQAAPADIYEAAKVDGATPFQQFFHISMPQLAGIISVLFLLRFVWTFNKFDDIFLMTGGASGTTTLTVDVYRQAFALSDLGAGAAVAVVIFALLGIFVAVQIKFVSKDESL